MATTKALLDRNYTVKPFKAFQSQSYDYVSGSSSNPDQVVIDLAIEPPTDFLLNLATGSTIPGVQNDSDRYAYPTFNSILQNFYEPSGSITEVTNFYPSSSAFVVSIASLAFGEEVKPGSFRLVGEDSIDEIRDRGDGKLYLNDTSTQLGNIFYGAGIAVIQRDESESSNTLVNSGGLAIQGSGRITTSFNSTLTIYEHTVVCEMNPGEFNWTWNPSLLSGSNDQGESVYSQFATGSLTPYVTTIGLYNELGEMMAVARLSRPLPRTQLTKQTIVIKFDT